MIDIPKVALSLILLISMYILSVQSSIMDLPISMKPRNGLRATLCVPWITQKVVVREM